MHLTHVSISKPKMISKWLLIAILHIRRCNVLTYKTTIWSAKLYETLISALPCCKFKFAKRTHYCQRQNILSWTILFCPRNLCFVSDKILLSRTIFFCPGQNFLSWTKLVLSGTKNILSGQMDRALVFKIKEHDQFSSAYFFNLFLW